MSGEKFYKQERARQAKFKKSEKELDKKYKKILDEETEFDYLNSIRPEDSTADPMNFKNGGLVSRGQGRVIKTKKTKIY
jgi:hypothetical protein